MRNSKCQRYFPLLRTIYSIICACITSVHAVGLNNTGEDLQVYGVQITVCGHGDNESVRSSLTKVLTSFRHLISITLSTDVW
jgi:hypothetical protein